MSKTFLFAPLHASSLLEMLPIAQKLADDGIYEPVFYIFRKIPDNYLAKLRTQGLKMIGPLAPQRIQDSVINQPSRVDASQEKKTSGLKSITKRAFSLPLFSLFWYLVEFSGQLGLARKTIRKESVAALIVAGDRHVGWETALIKAANKLGIPSLIIPIAISDPLGAVNFRLASPNPGQFLVGTWLEKLVAHIFPRWVYEYNHQKLFFTPVGNALAAWVLGMMPVNPWILGGGAATHMAVESQWMKQRFLSQGMLPEKITVTGKASMDQIIQTIQGAARSNLRRQLNIAEHQSIILCAVPQLGEHGLLLWAEHWRETEFLFDTLTQQQDVAVVLSLHPKSDPKAYQSLADKYGAIIATQRIYELLPICDIFVATFSSVVMQAVAISKPTIVVDFYGLNYTFYDQAPGVNVLRDRNELSPAISRLLKDRKYYSMLATEQRTNGSTWALIDGLCTQRIVDMIYKLIASHNTSAT